MAVAVRQTSDFLAILLPTLWAIATILAAFRGNDPLKEETKTLFAFKAPATVVALFWKDAIIHIVMLVALGSGDGKIYEDSADPDAIGTDIRAWVLKFSALSGYIVLLLTMPLL